MRKILGIGETILDILFKDRKPVAAVPGGSSFNSIVSLARAGMHTQFVGEAGVDEPGKQILAFLQENEVDTSGFCLRKDIKTAVSLAYLNENNDAEYVFYKYPPTLNPNFKMPVIEAGDMMLYGSFYAVCPSIHTQVDHVLQTAQTQGAFVYYDINFRRSHRHELDELLPTIRSNMSRSSVVRGSADDFDIMFNERNAQKLYEQHIAPYCPLFICTAGAEEIVVCTPNGTITHHVAPLQTISTVGAGDNFNAGFLYAMMQHNVAAKELLNGTPHTWLPLLKSGCRFAANVCSSLHNSISDTLAQELKAEKSSF